MALFQLGAFSGHAGAALPFKIEGDALVSADYDALAWVIGSNRTFSSVHGVPRGGLPLAVALQSYATTDGPPLIVDDVLTTGTSMEAFRQRLGLLNPLGVVIFARGPCPNWIHPVFTLSAWAR